jgi:hypothetical protein
MVPVWWCDRRRWCEGGMKVVISVLDWIMGEKENIFFDGTVGVE